MSDRLPWTALLLASALAAFLAQAYAGDAPSGGSPRPAEPAAPKPAAAPAQPPPAPPEPDIDEYKRNLEPVVYRPFRGPAWEYADLAAAALLLAAGIVLVIRRARTRWLLLLLTASLLYLGFWRGGCICPIGATAAVARGIVHPELVGTVTLALFLLPLAVALAAGRVFCGTVCPQGAVQHLIIHRRARYVRVPRILDRVLRWIPVALVLATAWIALRGPLNLVCRLDPFVTAFHEAEALIRKGLALCGAAWAEPGAVGVGDFAAWAFLAGALAVCAVIPRAFCRYVCPYGVLLGVCAKFAFRRRTLAAGRCTGCARCGRACPMDAISPAPGGGRRVDPLRCVECGLCDEACEIPPSSPFPS